MLKPTINTSSDRILATLPIKHGVSASRLYLPKDNNQHSVFAYLCAYFVHISPQKWQQRFIDGDIFAQVGDIFIKLDINAVYQDYQNGYIYYYRYVDNEVHVPFYHQVIFENERFMVVDKPHFLTMTPSGQYVRQTLLTRLKDETQNNDLTPIHRLDKQTAGLVLFCKDKKYRAIYQALFAKQSINKLYHAIAPVNTTLDFPMRLSLYIDRADIFYTMQVIDKQGVYNSHTDIEIIQMNHHQTWAKYQLKPLTGKLHQLRVHLNHLGIAIKNDDYYPVIQHKASDDFSNPLQLLAKAIEFTDPISHQHYYFESDRQLVLPE